MTYNRKTWNYDRPICFWEEMPWFVRWPAGILATLYFGIPMLASGGLLIKYYFY